MRFFLLSRVFGLVQLFAFLVFPPLKQCSGERGKAARMKRLLYIYCPAQLVVTGALRLLLPGGVSILFEEDGKSL